MIGLLLKEQTSDLHDLVEQKLMSDKIMDKSFSVDDYKMVITKNYQFLKHFESIVFKSLSQETAGKLGLQNRAKLKFLESDMQSLGLETKYSAESPTIKSEAEALGILYVMEGATLGGNIIARNLAKNPNFQDIKLNYFGAYGDQTGVLWKQFREVLENHQAEESSADYLQGAKRAYEFLLNN